MRCNTIGLVAANQLINEVIAIMQVVSVMEVISCVKECKYTKRYQRTFVEANNLIKHENPDLLYYPRFDFDIYNGSKSWQK